jgi:membrane protease YdiL (CAAX protease family)
MVVSQLVVKRFFAIGRILLFYSISVIIFATSSGVTKNRVLGDQLSFLLSSILTMTLVVLFARWEKMSLKDVGLKVVNGSLLRFLTGLGIGLVMVVVQAFIIVKFTDVKFTLASNIQALNVITSLMLYLLIACREELVFRSYAIRSLASAISPSSALVIMTVIFVIEHVIGGMSWKMAIVGTGLGGILFGMAAVKSKGLALPLGLHFSWNATQWLLGFKNNTGVWREIVEKGQEPQAENIALAGFVCVMCVSILGIWFFYRNAK